VSFGFIAMAFEEFLLPELSLEYQTTIHPFIKSYGAFTILSFFFDYSNYILVTMGFERMAE